MFCRFSFILGIRRGVRVVYGAALEKRSPVIPERGFESHPLRHPTERCWSGLSGAPGERVSGFPTVGSNPTLSAIYLKTPSPCIPLPQGREKDKKEGLAPLFNFL